VDVASMNLFLALLALVALAGTATVGTVVVVGRGPRLARMRDDLADAALPLALAVAATCTAGSLYYSEVAGFTPCKLCWFQRICMYPLVVLLGVAVLRRDRAVRAYALPLSLLGGAVSIYHYQLQRFPSQASAVCSVDAPCTAREVDQFGFITIPFMALCGFALISVLLIGLRPAPDARSV
jgi:disulfide bond formation protein DsbB